MCIPDSADFGAPDGHVDNKPSAAAASDGARLELADDVERDGPARANEVRVDLIGTTRARCVVDGEVPPEVMMRWRLQR